MNYFFIAASVMGLMTFIGHFSYGRQRYIIPMAESDLEPVVKEEIHCLFHFVSVFIVLSTFVLAACGFDVISSMQGFGLVLFVALNFGMFAIWQLFLAFDSEIQSPYRNLFQWAPFAGISIFSLLGIYF
ncbi:hypothetical protein GCM10007978_32450 [Shewanella hanedai]|uniref:DUF423 domain-containing protein n=1 Tax=Shewanella hanedai TaxID=25 RepID=A0A553JK88_SHEHA|nr:hypothetical protein [Shewanella hanedai]TRY12861.1 hypothetical protein FN961_18775 [Shewanella hanedai]GGI92470.1 hypothetical protein GCM10007978_32450 [Shewanella hanedai]